MSTELQQTHDAGESAEVHARRYAEDECASGSPEPITDYADRRGE